MHSRWFNLTVFLLWLTMMSWLVTQKVLPALLIGEPPSYKRILAAQHKNPAVGWDMFWGDRRLGWAISRTTPLPNDLTEVDSRIHFDELPIGEMTPGWLQAIVRPLGNLRTRLQLDALSTLVFDPLGGLSRFESAVQFEPKVDALKIRGVIDGGKMTLTVRAGDVSYDKEMPVPASAMMGDAFSPQSELPGLREGQTWTVEVYSPLLPANAPMEILQARVVRKESIHWEDKIVEAWRVEYTKDPGSESNRSEACQGRLWVHPRGTVLKQEVRLFNAPLMLVRLSDEAAEELAKKVGDELGTGRYDMLGRPREKAVKGK